MPKSNVTATIINCLISAWYYMGLCNT